MRASVSLVGVVAATALLASGCSGERPNAAAPTPVSIPDDWIASESSSHDVRIALPPWLVAFDTTDGVLANEASPAGTESMQLLVAGPRADLQPAFGQDLRAWLSERLRDVGSGTSAFEDVWLPSGSAVKMDRTDRAGTALAWRHRAWAIRTPAGVAFLWIDGPPNAWTDREADLARIPVLLELRP
jgi:hypothetical protein